MVRPTINYCIYVVKSIYDSIARDMTTLGIRFRALRIHTYQEISIGRDGQRSCDIHVNGFMTHYYMAYTETNRTMTHVSLGGSILRLQKVVSAPGVVGMTDIYGHENS